MRTHRSLCARAPERWMTSLPPSLSLGDEETCCSTYPTATPSHPLSTPAATHTHILLRTTFIHPTRRRRPSHLEKKIEEKHAAVKEKNTETTTIHLRGGTPWPSAYSATLLFTLRPLLLPPSPTPPPPTTTVVAAAAAVLVLLFSCRVAQHGRTNC